MKKIMTLVVLIGGAVWAYASVYAHGEEENQKFKSISEIGSAFPGTGHVMIEMGYRYSALYFAAKQKKWEFAEYQVDEMEELVERFEIISKKRKESIEQFSEAVFKNLEKAVASRNWKTFSKGFDVMRGQCMACHAKNDVGYITLPIPTKHQSPVLE